MNRRLPALAGVLGLAGLAPLIACGLATISAPSELAAKWLLAMMTYAALVLSFLGGVHWGFALDEAVPLAGSGGRAERVRLIFGVLPVLLGWAALLMPLVIPAEWGLVLLLIGFLATAAIESQGRREKLVPGGYMVLRWVISAVAIALLVTVLVVRLLGARVIL
jgi:hypothetical protein